MGKTVDQIDIRKKYGINIMAIKIGGSINLAITPDLVLDNTMSMMVLGEAKAIQKCFHI